MIVTIAGTSGSGKTYLVRTFLEYVEKYKGSIVPTFIKDRKPPIGYDIVLPGCVESVFLVGAYGEVDTAGCDTIRDVVQVFDLIQEKAVKGHVLYEGLIVMNHTRGPGLVHIASENGEEFHVIQLDTPLATCFASINARRAARGQDKILKRVNTEGNYNRALNYCTKMRWSGAIIHKCNREQALDVLLGLLLGV